MFSANTRAPPEEIRATKAAGIELFKVPFGPGPEKLVVFIPSTYTSPPAARDRSTLVLTSNGNTRFHRRFPDGPNFATNPRCSNVVRFCWLPAMKTSPAPSTTTAVARSLSFVPQEWPYGIGAATVSRGKTETATIATMVIEVASRLRKRAPPHVTHLQQRLNVSYLVT